MASTFQPIHALRANASLTVVAEAARKTADREWDHAEALKQRWAQRDTYENQMAYESAQATAAALSMLADHLYRLAGLSRGAPVSGFMG